MCFSTATSLEVLAANHIVSFILYYTYDKILSLFYVFIGFMQFWDYLFWKFPKKSNINFWATKMAMLNNHIQPIVFAIAISYYKKIWLDTFNIIIILLYSIIALIYSIYAWFHIDYTVVTPESSPGLYWKWNHFPGNYILYILFVFVIISLLFTYYPYPLNITFCIAVICILIYAYMNYKKQSDFSILWCNYSIYLPVFTLLFYISKDVLDHWNT